MIEVPADRDPAKMARLDEVDAQFVPDPRQHGHETLASLHAEMAEESEAGKDMAPVVARIRDEGRARPEPVRTGASAAQEHQIGNFEAMVRDRKAGGYFMADADGEYRAPRRAGQGRAA